MKYINIVVLSGKPGPALSNEVQQIVCTTPRGKQWRRDLQQKCVGAVKVQHLDLIEDLSTKVK